MSWKWVTRGLKSREDFARLNAVEKATEGVAVSKRSLRVVATKSAAELRSFFGLRLRQVVAGEVVDEFRGSDRIAETRPVLTWKELHELSPKIAAFLSRTKGFEKMTTVQRLSLPLGFAGESFVAVAPTGSGKTFAFVCPVIHRLAEQASDSGKKVRAAILAPTKELVKQTTAVVADLIQAAELELTVLDANTSRTREAPLPVADILVATPQALAGYHRASGKPLSRVETLVFDEVDALLGTTVVSCCERVVKAIKTKKLQILMLSASLPDAGPVLEFVRQFLPVFAPIISVEPPPPATDAPAPPDVVANVKMIGAGAEQGKIACLRMLLADHALIPPCLLFVQDTGRADELTRLLRKLLEKSPLIGDCKPEDLVAPFHGKLRAEKRIRNFQSFQEGKVWYLVCTDLGCRGLDFRDVRVIVNYDIPLTTDSLIHRLGRTGRVDMAKGISYIFYTREDELRLRDVVNTLQTKYRITDLPSRLRALRPRRVLKGLPLREPIAAVAKPKLAARLEAAEERTRDAKRARRLAEEAEKEGGAQRDEEDSDLGDEEDDDLEDEEDEDEAEDE